MLRKCHLKVELIGDDFQVEKKVRVVHTGHVQG